MDAVMVILKAAKDRTIDIISSVFVFRVSDSEFDRIETLMELGISITLTG